MGEGTIEVAENLHQRESRKSPEQRDRSKPFQRPFKVKNRSAPLYAIGSNIFILSSFSDYLD